MKTNRLCKSAYSPSSNSTTKTLNWYSHSFHSLGPNPLNFIFFVFRQKLSRLLNQRVGKSQFKTLDWKPSGNEMESFCPLLYQKLKHTLLSAPQILVNRSLPSSKKQAKCTTFLVEMSFICMKMKNQFHIKG